MGNLLQQAAKPQKILGVDPGLGRTGFGLISVTSYRQAPVAESWGVMTTDKPTDMGQRLLELYRDFSGLLAQTRPDVVAIETLFFIRNITTAMPVAQARGILLLAIAEANIRMVEYSPMQIKKALTGYGKADKAEMTTAVVQRLKLDKAPKPDDAADGLAIALTHQQLGMPIEAARLAR